MKPEKLLEIYKNLNKQKDDFLNLIAHELRTPITILKSSLETLRVMKDHQNEEMLDSLLGISINEILKLQEMIEKIILLQGLKLKQYIINPKNINVKKCIIDIIQNNKDWNIKNVDIVIDIPEELIIKFDEKLMYQMFSNLIENGLKFNNDNGKLYIRLVHKNLLLFEDTGIGISKDEQLYIFDEFRQVVDVKYHSSGLGLGLAIVKYIAKITKIIVELDSEVGIGTKIYLIFI